MKSFNEMFHHTQNLPTIPEVVIDLIKSFDDPRADIRKIAKEIALDQVLMARVLRMANSPRFGLSKQIASIDDAILVMGFNALRTLVVAGGLAGAFKGPPGFDLKGFWRLSAANAGYAKWLAKSLGMREDFAFTGGLMLHIGVLLILLENPDQAEVVERAVATGGYRAAIEESILGFNHAEVGAELASRWNLPQAMIDAFRDYPEPLAQSEFMPLAGIYHLADYLAGKALNGAEPQEIREGLPLEVLAKLGLEADLLVANLPSLSEVSAGLEELLS